MGNYDPNRVVQDFANRTWANYEFIEDEYKREPRSSKVYNVTQLVNSLLGLLVFPQQRFYLHLLAMPLADLEQNGWPSPNILMGKESTPDLRALLRRFRNGVAHYRIKFLADDNNNLVGIIVSDAFPHQEVDWQMRISVRDLRDFLKKFTELIDQMSPDEAGEMVQQEMMDI